MQLAKDYCCTLEQAAGCKNIFSIYKREEGRRKFQEQKECFLKIACVHNKLLVTGQEEILKWCEKKYQNKGAVWFMELSVLRELEEKLADYGYQIGRAIRFCFGVGRVIRGKEK